MALEPPVRNQRSDRGTRCTAQVPGALGTLIATIPAQPSEAPCPSLPGVEATPEVDHDVPNQHAVKPSRRRGSPDRTPTPVAAAQLPGLSSPESAKRFRASSIHPRGGGPAKA